MKDGPAHGMPVHIADDHGQRAAEDHDWQAELIAKKLKGMPGHVNLIPLNDVVESPYKPSRRIGAFQQKLESLGVTATVRRSLGGDIDASCGQLRRKEMQERGQL